VNPAFISFLFDLVNEFATGGFHLPLPFTVPTAENIPWPNDKIKPLVMGQGEQNTFQHAE